MGSYYVKVSESRNSPPKKTRETCTEPWEREGTMYWRERERKRERTRQVDRQSDRTDRDWQTYQTDIETRGPLILYRSPEAEDMLKPAIAAEKKFKHSPRVGADNPFGPKFWYQQEGLITTEAYLSYKLIIWAFGSSELKTEAAQG